MPCEITKQKMELLKPGSLFMLVTFVHIYHYKKMQRHYIKLLTQKCENEMMGTKAKQE